jgi:hypothetical protein
MYRPMTGPSPTAMHQFRCRRGFDAAWDLFDRPARALLALVLLANAPLVRAAAALEQSPDLVKQRLLEALDVPVRHFDIGETRQAA